MKTSKYFIQSLLFLLLIIVIGCKKDPPKTLPEVSTTEISSITSISARSGGTITDDGNSPVSSRGVCWSTNESPTISDNKTSDGSGEGIFASSITGLLPGKLYYVRAYATNVVGTSYGSQLSMTTTPILPTITTTDISEITSSSAKSGGNITDDGGSPVTARGVCWSTNQNPTITDSKTSDGVGVGTFISLITELLPGGTYYARAYATNSVGTAYGVQTTIMTTSIVPILSTTELIGISSTSATVSGNITSDGGAAVIARGVCWSRNTMPVVGTDSTTNNGFGTGIFTSSVTDLSPGKTYYIRAYATNSVGTAYSNQITVSTSAILPVLTTSEVFDITPTTASSGGNITNDGGSTITTRGVCWSTSQNPTKANSITTNGTGTGTYTSSMNDLTPGETYYVRAYATNSVGTSYGNQVTFNASITTPTISTTEITAITSTTATSGGNITSDGGAGVTARGVCWSTSQNPTTANSKTTNGMGTGSFISSITALIPGATYYLRAYATNSVGTAYGAQISFNTSANVPTVTTIEITEITLESAICGGDVTNDGGTSVTSRGVCWSTTQEPTIANNKTINGVGTGTFVSNLTNLTQNTTYYVRAYATNSTGTNYGQTLVFKTIDENLLIHAEQMYPGVTGEEVTAVLNGKSIKCLLINKLYIYQGDILIPTEITKGFSSTDIHKWPDNTVYYKITLSPGMTPVLLDAIDEAINEYENKTNLIFKERVNEKYYVEFTFDPDGCGSVPGMRIRDYLMGEDPYVYDHNMIKLAHWARKGSVLHEIGHTIGLFHEHTRPDRDVYIDLQDSNIKKEALSQFEIGEGNIISPGFDWESIMLYPSVSEFSIDGRPTMLRVSNGKPFDSNREYLSEGDVNTINVMYPAKPKVTTTSVISITSNSATCKGEVLNDGGWNVYERGVCWGTNQDPTIEDNKITSGSGIGSYSCDITNLNPNTTYYVRSYAINGSGLGPGYGRILSFKTNVATQVPTVSTSDPSDIKSNSANVGGNVTSDGGSNVTEHGVYWSTNPLISGNKLKIESGDAVFSGTLTGLTPSTTYYVKAYAINSQGIGYGSQVNFTTVAGGIAPDAAFSANPTTIKEGDSVQFTDQSTNNPTSWGWNFGDGGTSTSRNPSHIYASAGTYTVSLTATNITGSNTLTKTNYIVVSPAGYSPVAAFSANPTTINEGQSVQFTDQSTNNPTSWSWDFGDGGTSNAQNPSHTYSSAGTYSVLLRVTNNYGSNTLTKTTYITVNAVIGDIIFNPNLTYGSVTDIDGNVYKTIQIGTQVWMAENLRTTKYRNGDVISTTTPATLDISSESSPKYQWAHSGNESRAVFYGRLYTWYAAIDSRGVCPTGWHLPTDSEWSLLVSFLGGDSVAGGKLKETGTTHWQDPNFGATNSSGFTALPSGGRSYNGQFSDFGTHAMWWTPYVSSKIDVLRRNLYYNTGEIYAIGDTEVSGFSIRCVKD